MISLKDKLVTRSARVGVMGLGYVGLPMALEAARAGFDVVGIDSDPKRVEKVNKGSSYIGDVDAPQLKEVVREKRLKATTSLKALAKCDVVLLCLPTPLTPNKDLDLSAVKEGIEAAARYAHEDMLIVLESTTYPGTTKDILVPALRAQGFTPGKTIYVSYSPERIDPSNTDYSTANTSKVVSGATAKCRAMALDFYKQFIHKPIPVSSPGVAEMTKIFENVFRSVNIGLVNELAQICKRMGIDVYEVIETAATKEFGFMPFYPGPGVGGHCIPLDPYYLTWKTRAYDIHPRFIELATDINENMPYYVVDIIGDVLNSGGKCYKNTPVLLLGIAYKKDTADSRESPAVKVLTLLLDKQARVSYHDPFCPRLRVGTTTLKSVALSPAVLKKNACTVILTDHSDINYAAVVAHSQRVVDTRNATRHVRTGRGKVVRL